MCLFGSKTVFLGQKVEYNMAYIAYYIELNLQVCKMRKNDPFDAEIANMSQTKIFMASFALAERHPATLFIRSMLD